MYDNMRKGEKALNAYLFLSLKQNAQGSIKDFQCHRSIPINWLKIVKYQLYFMKKFQHQFLLYCEVQRQDEERIS